MPPVDAPPIASILISSMRDIGYSLETALADVVDNSITAGARKIHIHVDTTSPEVAIGIVDDGVGMSRDQLYEAMRLGSRHPNQLRGHHDLGRFGLGLKTASFSQCRKLTVVTRKAGVTWVAIWDLDFVEHEDKWSLIMSEETTGIPFVEYLGQEGALVIWERMDRAVEKDQSADGRRYFVRRVDEARRHLELVFHRYLAGDTGLKRIVILLNDQPLRPFDPFHAAHPATIRGQSERVLVGEYSVDITPFTLPHHRNVSPTDWEHYAGTDGYLRNQGFYLYREKRLIVHGTWFGLARQMELTKLTRVRIDMPNRLDADWHVDVKKASARPPVQVRERLQRIISEIGAPSRTVYTRRGRALHDSRLPIWQRVQENGIVVYRLNAQNPVIAAFEKHLLADQRGAFARLLQAVGAGLPMDGIFADLAGSPESIKSETLSDDSLKYFIECTWAGLLAGGVGRDTIPDMMRVVEPFRSNWDRTETLLDDIRRDPRP